MSRDGICSDSNKNYILVSCYGIDNGRESQSNNLIESFEIKSRKAGNIYVISFMAEATDGQAGHLVVITIVYEHLRDQNGR